MESIEKILDDILDGNSSGAYDLVFNELNQRAASTISDMKSDYIADIFGGSVSEKKDDEDEEEVEGEEEGEEDEDE